MSAPEEQSSKRTPFSAKLPQTTVDAVLPLVQKLAEFGTAATPHRIAQLMGTTPASSAFKTKLAAAGYYGLLIKDADRRAVTERGGRIAGDNISQVTAAKREAVMSTSFGPLIHAFRGRAADENVLAARLQSDLGVPDGSAAGLASTLVESATQAGLIDGSGRFDVGAIEEYADLRPLTTPPSNGKPRTAVPRQDAPKPQTVEKPVANSKPAEYKQPEEPPPFSPAVQVVVKIDATGLTPQQIAELIRELQRQPSL